jgi:Bax protein
MEVHDDRDLKEISPKQLSALLLGALLLILGIHWLSSEREKSYRVKSIIVRVDSVHQIELLKDSLVKPVLYSHVAGLDRLDVKKIKETFISAVLPAVLVAKHNIREDSLKVSRLSKKKYWNKHDSTVYLELKKYFKSNSIEQLLSRMGSLPNSIVLAQAAVETGWGQSRFFLEGNNVFGIWSYNSAEPRIEASSSRESTSVYVRSYADISESIADYFRTLGSAYPYRELRKARVETHDPFELLTHLKYYSERRTAYVNQLKSVIIQNDLTKYDRYRIDPRYLVKE